MCVYMCVCACSVLPDPMDYSLLVSSVHGIFQTRILGPFPLPGDFLNSGIKPSSFILCIDRWILYHWATWKAQNGGFYKWTSSGIRELSLWLSLTIYILLVLLQIWKIKEREKCVCERERERKKIGWKFYWPWSLLSCLGLSEMDAYQVEKTVAINQILSWLSSGCQIVFIRHDYRPKPVL